MLKQVTKVVLKNSSGKILLLLRSETAPNRALLWDLPGGTAEAGETIRRAVVRETKEETGIKLTNPQLVFTSIKDWGSKWHYFYDEVDKDDVTLSFEHSEYLWADEDFINTDKRMSGFQRRDINKVLKTGRDF